MTASRCAAGPWPVLLADARRAPVEPADSLVRALRPGADTDPDALAAYCGERLAVHRCPSRVEILPDSPKTASGKILRRELCSLTHEN